MELGLYTFAELGPGRSPEQRLRELMEEVELADQVGLDVFGVGEHHRSDFVVSAPAVVLAAAAARTERIRLTSAVTVLSSDDPVRVFQEFATVDLLSGGRTEIMAGRGSFIGVVPALRLRPRGLRRPLRREARAVAPPPRGRARDLVRQAPPADRRARRLPAAGAGAAAGLGRRRREPRIGGSGRQARASARARDHRRAARAFRPVRGAAPSRRRRSGPRAARALDQFPWLRRREPGGGGGRLLPGLRRNDEPDRTRARGWPALQRQDYDALRSPRGALLVGSPEQVAEKILFQHELFEHDRCLAQFSVGTLPHASVLRSIELFGTEVAPLVRAELGRHAA